LRVEPKQVPMYVYQSVPAFAQHMDGYVRRALAAGRYGWAVTDCVVTLVDCGYSVADGPPSKRGPLSTPTDFRDLTPIVLRQALADAGTVVCEPALRATLEAPAWAASAVLTALGRLGAAVRDQAVRGDLTTVRAVLPATRLRELARQLPGLTAGEGVLESEFDGYRPVHGSPPVRPGTVG
jgi:ribosomal protection tetracycline resistance protein